MNNILFTRLQETDLPFLKEVYDYYTLNTTSIYFLNPVTTEQLKGFIPLNDPVYHSFLIRTENGEPAGFCYFSRFRPREAFNISVEMTIYLKPDFTGKGYGHQALAFMESLIRKGGFKNIMALIGGENEASAGLFEKHGFECCAVLRQVAEKFGRRLDLKMYQKLL